MPFFIGVDSQVQVLVHSSSQSVDKKKKGSPITAAPAKKIPYPKMQGVRRSGRVRSRPSSKIISSVEEPIILSEEEVEAGLSPVKEVVATEPVGDLPSASGAASPFPQGRDSEAPPTLSSPIISHSLHPDLEVIFLYLLWD